MTKILYFADKRSMKPLVTLIGKSSLVLTVYSTYLGSTYRSLPDQARKELQAGR